MPAYEIRLVGDPVLRTPAREIDDIDGRLVQLCDEMFDTMYEAPGIGLAAPQVGVRKRLFVYDIGEGPQVVINPTLTESDGEWLFDEGCLSVPGLSWEILRPKTVHLTGVDLDGNDVSIEADEILARLFQHELDHLDGILLLDRLDDDQRRGAMRLLREGALGSDSRPESDSGLRLP